jgi:hypothetical protein
MKQSSMSTSRPLGSMPSVLSGKTGIWGGGGTVGKRKWRRFEWWWLEIVTMDIERDMIGWNIREKVAVWVTVVQMWVVHVVTVDQWVTVVEWLWNRWKEEAEAVRMVVVGDRECQYWVSYDRFKN